MRERERERQAPPVTRRSVSVLQSVRREASSGYLTPSLSFSVCLSDWVCLSISHTLTHVNMHTRTHTRARTHATHRDIHFTPRSRAQHVQKCDEGGELKGRGGRRFRSTGRPAQRDGGLCLPSSSSVSYVPSILPTQLLHVKRESQALATENNVLRVGRLRLHLVLVPEYLHADLLVTSCLPACLPADLSARRRRRAGAGGSV